MLNLAVTEYIWPFCRITMSPYDSKCRPRALVGWAFHASICPFILRHARMLYEIKTVT